MDLTANNRLTTTCLLILTGIAATAALIYTKSILVPFVISLFIYLAILPALNHFQRRFKVSHNIAAILIGAIYLLVSALLIFVFIQMFQVMIEQIGLYRTRIFELIAQANEMIPSWAGTINLQSVKEQMAQIPVLEVLGGLTGGVFGFLSNSALVIIFTLFLLASDPLIIENELFHEFQIKVSRYVVTKLFVSTLTAAITFIVLFAVGADLALMFALLTFLLNFIPNVGSLFAIVLPLPILYLQFGFGWPFWTTLGVCGVVQFSIGNILEPQILGDSLDLHPVTVLLFLMFWGLVWGVPGMFLAAPITSLMKILFSRIEMTKPLAELMSGRF